MHFFVVLIAFYQNEIVDFLSYFLRISRIWNNFTKKFLKWQFYIYIYLYLKYASSSRNSGEKSIIIICISYDIPALCKNNRLVTDWPK